jgi:hypothetical protein
MGRFLRIAFGYVGGIALAVGGGYLFTQDLAAAGAIVLAFSAVLLAIGYYS